MTRSIEAATRLLLHAKHFAIPTDESGIRDTHLRGQTIRVAQRACLSCAEGAARVTRADKARAFMIARGDRDLDCDLDLDLDGRDADATDSSRGSLGGSGNYRWSLQSIAFRRIAST